MTNTLSASLLPVILSEANIPAAATDAVPVTHYTSQLLARILTIPDAKYTPRSAIVSVAALFSLFQARQTSDHVLLLVLGVFHVFFCLMVIQ